MACTPRLRPTPKCLVLLQCVTAKHGKAAGDCLRFFEDKSTSDSDSEGLQPAKQRLLAYIMAHSSNDFSSGFRNAAYSTSGGWC